MVYPEPWLSISNCWLATLSYQCETHYITNMTDISLTPLSGFTTDTYWRSSAEEPQGYKCSILQWKSWVCPQYDLLRATRAPLLVNRDVDEKPKGTLLLLTSLIMTNMLKEGMGMLRTRVPKTHSCTDQNWRPISLQNIQHVINEFFNFYDWSTVCFPRAEGECIDKRCAIYLHLHICHVIIKSPLNGTWRYRINSKNRCI